MFGLPCPQSGFHCTCDLRSDALRRVGSHRHGLSDDRKKCLNDAVFCAGFDPPFTPGHLEASPVIRGAPSAAFTAGRGYGGRRGADWYGFTP